ncbi:cytochrome P450 2J4-like [Asterias amurensis]|uniref:cytochrome P450 2J4-like n=1 Tax=Asterias amurensis TaxID=7602 RepID=UPI003AB6375D
MMFENMEYVLGYVYEQMVGRNVVLLFAISLCATYGLWKRRRADLPPGPWGLPYFGMVPYFFLVEWLFGLQRREILENFGAKYGKIFSFTAFGRLVVVLNDGQTIKEVYQLQELNDRPKLKINNQSLGQGVAFANGDCWKEQRRFTIKTLDRLDAGKAIHEEKLSEEAIALLGAIEALDGKAFDPKHHMMICVSNIITSMLYSRRHEYNDAEYRDYLDMIEDITYLMGTAGAMPTTPILKHLPQGKRLRDNIIAERLYMKRIVRERQASHDPLGDPRDFTDAYLSEIPNEELTHLSHGNLTHTLIQIFSAGTANISTTLRWALLYMIANPDVQARVQEELDRVVGQDRMPKLSDEASLPYTQATLLELQRMSTVAPFGLAHMSSADAKYRGYTIPAHTVVIPNMWAIHYNPKMWEEPFKFNPGRFLDEQDKVKGAERVVSFSAGNRVCIGRHLSRMEMYTFLTHLLHKFSFRKADSSPPLSFKGSGGFARVPDQYFLHAVKRF